MSEIRNDYFNRLLNEIRSLEQRLLSLRNSGALPFSFFSESFNKTQEISRLLHELEFLQIDEMKQQMGQLVQFLSEVKQEKNAIQESITPENQIIPEYESVKNHSVEGFTLPEYRNPRVNKAALSSEKIQTPSQQTDKDIKPVIPSLNDKISPAITNLDLRRNISLNDRFLFQRELFHNDREAMNQMMICLNAFDNFDQAESYLREHCNWNFDTPVVEDFLKVIRKGFA
ncbi:MAG: hypothetical protein LLF80_08430 [Porphyromonadaceae bacterium]|nr:hypothetical protein [Porphyromonadaceae bacterium]